MDPLGEIIGSDSQMLAVECHRLYAAPEFGSFVRAACVGSGRSFYAVVTRASTGPFDGNRIVQAHRLAPGELEQRKPHLTTILRTTFEARTLGWGEGSARSCGTPPAPPRLHCFVYPSEDAEVRELTKTPAFLRSLTQVVDVPLEDLLVAAIDAARQSWGGEAPVVAWGKYLARLLHSDYVTLEGVMQRLAPPAAPASSGGPRWEAGIPLSGGDPFGD